MESVQRKTAKATYVYKYIKNLLTLKRFFELFYEIRIKYVNNTL